MNSITLHAGPTPSASATLRVAIISHVSPRDQYGAAASLRRHLDSMTSDTDIAVLVCSPPAARGHHATKLEPGAPERQGLVRWDEQLWRIAIRPNYRHMSRLSQAWAAADRCLHPNPSPMLASIAEWRPDIIHLNSLILEPLISAIRRHPQLCRVPIVASVRESLLPSLPRRRVTLLSEVRTFVCISPVVAHHLHVCLEGLRSDKTVVIANLTSGRPSLSKDEGRQLRHLDKAKVATTFAFIGRLEPWKGPHRALFAFLLRRPATSRLLVFGGGRHPLALLVRLVLRVSRHTSWQGEVAALTDSPQYWKVDVVVRADSEYLGLGRVGSEALKSGKVLIMPDPLDCPLTHEERDSPLIVWTEGSGILAVGRAMRKAQRLIEECREADRFMTDLSGSHRAEVLTGESGLEQTAYRQQWSAVYHEAAQPPGTQARRTLSHADGSDPEPYGPAQEDTPSSAAHR